MNVNIASNNTSKQSQLNQNINRNNNRLRHKFMVLSKEIRDLKQTTRTEASIFVVTNDNKLYCVNGKHRFQDMRAHVFDTNVSNDEMGELKSETLDSSVDEDESQCTFNRQIGTMSQEGRSGEGSHSASCGMA
ncbi:Hypothetical predicted protein, partial [Prunus dulcis]